MSSSGFSGYGAASGSYMAARNNSNDSNYSTGGGAREYQQRLRQQRIESKGRYNRAIRNGEISPFNLNSPFWASQPARQVAAPTSRVTPVEPEADRQRRVAREQQARAQEANTRAAQAKANQKKEFNDAFIKARNAGQMYFKFSDGKVYNTSLSKDDQDWLKLNDNSSDFKMNINPLKIVNVRTMAGQTGQPYLPESEDEQIYQA